MTDDELKQLSPAMLVLATTSVTLNDITKPVHVWATERKLTLTKIRDRRKRNSWAESLQPGNLSSVNIRNRWISQPNNLYFKGRKQQ